MSANIYDNQNNANGKCANRLCGFSYRKMYPKACFYHVVRRSWICTSCAQVLNREWATQTARMHERDKGKAPCITSEDVTVLLLQNKFV